MHRRKARTMTRNTPDMTGKVSEITDRRQLRERLGYHVELRHRAEQSGRVGTVALYDGYIKAELARLTVLSAEPVEQRDDWEQQLLAPQESESAAADALTIEIGNAPSADLDHCPTCGRRIKDYDMTGREDESGQRHCVAHPLRRDRVIEWVDDIDGEILTEESLAAIDAGELYPGYSYTQTVDGFLVLTSPSGNSTTFVRTVVA